MDAGPPDTCALRLIGRRFTSAGKEDYTWTFDFENNASIATEGHWRLIESGRVITSSDDDGERFGQSHRASASNEVMAHCASQNVQAIFIDPSTGDLTVTFQNDARLQLLQLSSGYEAWRLVCDGAEIICTGGGHIVEL